MQVRNSFNNNFSVDSLFQKKAQDKKNILSTTENPLLKKTEQKFIKSSDDIREFSTTKLELYADDSAELEVDERTEDLSKLADSIKNSFDFETDFLKDIDMNEIKEGISKIAENYENAKNELIEKYGDEESKELLKQLDEVYEEKIVEISSKAETQTEARGRLLDFFRKAAEFELKIVQNNPDKNIEEMGLVFVQKNIPENVKEVYEEQAKQFREEILGLGKQFKHGINKNKDNILTTKH